MRELDISKVLDRAKEKQGVQSDYALCKISGFSPQLVANWRHGRSLPDEKSCVRIGQLAQVNPYVLIAECNAARAQDETQKTIWETIARKLELAERSAKIAAGDATKKGAKKRSSERPTSLIPVLAQ
jgi:hypothetical protein